MCNLREQNVKVGYSCDVASVTFTFHPVEYFLSRMLQFNVREEGITLGVLPATVTTVGQFNI